MKNNLIFIGMPAVGKSTVGIVVAKRLGMNFIDVDLLIQEQEKKLLREIIAEVGQDGFLKIENRVNAAVKAAFTAPIVSAATFRRSFMCVVYLLLASNRLFFSSAVRLSYPDFFSFSRMRSISSDWLFFRALYS